MGNQRSLNVQSQINCTLRESEFINVTKLCKHVTAYIIFVLFAKTELHVKILKLTSYMQDSVH